MTDLDAWAEALDDLAGCSCCSNPDTVTRLLGLDRDAELPTWRELIGRLAADLQPEGAVTEWAVVDDGRVIHIADATCPADALAGAHGHGTRGPVGVARRTVTCGPWQHLDGSPS